MSEEAPILPSEERVQSVVKRIVGLSRKDDAENRLLQLYEERFLHDAIKKDPECEIDKTSEQIAILKRLCVELPDFLLKFGLEQPLNYSPEHFHLLDLSKLDLPKEMRDYHNKHPMAFLRLSQAIIMNNEIVIKRDKIDFLRKTAHELIHGQAFHSLEVPQTEGGTLRERRGGITFSLYDKEGNFQTAFFNQINEAVTEQLARLYLRENVSKYPELAEDLEKVKQNLLKWKTIKEAEEGQSIIYVDDVTGLTVGEGHIGYSIPEHTYEHERHMLKRLIDRIYARNQDRFSDPDEVFLIFTKAYFTGRVLELARLIDSSFDYIDFRELGELTQKEQYKSNEKN